MMRKKNFVRHQQMKTDILAEVLTAIGRGASCKREVQAAAGLSWGKVSETVNLLLNRGIVVDCNIADRSPVGQGRKSSYFEFSGTDFLVMGMELQRHRIITAVTNPGGKVIGQNVLPFKRALHPENLRDRVFSAWNEQLNRSGITAEKIIALSFSLTGAVDGANKIWRQSSHVPDIRDYDFQPIAAMFPHLLYFSIEHDIPARARSVLRVEKWNDDNFVFMHIGGGVGMAVHNQAGFFTGSRGLAGEIGHIPVMPLPTGSSARLCSCGQTDCLETFLSDRALLAYASEHLGVAAADLPTLFAMATGAQMDAFYAYFYPYLRQAGITAVNLFDPTTLILGGELIEPWLSRLETELLPQLRAASWLHSPEQLKCYRMASCDSAFGTALNAAEPVILQLANKL